MKDKIPCSVEILTRNSAATIARCLESVKDFDDIIVLDGGSTDGTREIAARAGARVLDQRDRQGENQPISDFSAVRNRGLAAARHDWFMYIDSDEYLSPEAIEEIRGIAQSTEPEAYVWWQPRKYVFEGRVIECATTYPNQQIRLFHGKFVECFVKPIHERILVKPGVKTATLRNYEYVPLGSLASLTARWERYRDMEIAMAAGMPRAKIIRVVLGQIALFVFYAIRYLRNIFFCRGARLPFSYEWARHHMTFGFIRGLLELISKMALKAKSSGFRRQATAAAGAIRTVKYDEPREGGRAEIRRLQPKCIFEMGYRTTVKKYAMAYFFTAQKKTMKLIYISHWRFPSEKAFSPFAMKTCEGFAREGMAVELWIPRRRNPRHSNTDPFSYYGIRKNFIIRRLPVVDLMGVMPGRIGFALLLATFNASVALYMLMRRVRNTAVFYFHDIRDALLAVAIARNSFFEIHDFYRTGVGWINRRCFLRARGLIVTNRIKIAALRRDFGIPVGRMLHQSNAVDVERFALSVSKKEARAALNLPQDAAIVLYAGHLYEWKGVDTLLAAHQCLEPGAVIYFNGGTDEDIERFRVKARKSGAENVVIAGRRPYGETPLWLRSADVLALPNTARVQASYADTSPLKLFEYMASGSPIVASDLPSVRDIVDERMVRFFEPDNPEALCAAIHLCLSDPEESEKRAARAREAAGNFTWEKRNRAIADFVRKNLN